MTRRAMAPTLTRYVMAPGPGGPRDKAVRAELRALLAVARAAQRVDAHRTNGHGARCSCNFCHTDRGALARSLARLERAGKGRGTGKGRP